MFLHGIRENDIAFDTLEAGPTGGVLQRNWNGSLKRYSLKHEI